MSLFDGMRKVTAEHINKRAYIYVRQSTLGGVKKNIVGGQLQYEMDKLALKLGWDEANIRIVDEDQATSGSTSDGRYGYVEMLNDIVDGRVGAVLSTEPARVGRDTTDWHMLIKICDLTGTLLIDPDGVYDASDFNDNTMMKVKALLTDMELRWISVRLLRARLALAEKGELRFFLPVGYVYDEDKKITLAPDDDVQEAVRLVFAKFKELGSASKVVRYFNRKGLKFPTLVRGGPRKGLYDWIKLGVSRVQAMLHNPAYAGAYVFGRSKVKRKAVKRDGELPKMVKYQVRLKRGDWQFVFHDAHPAYITWAEFLENEKRISNNRSGPRGKVTGAAREGSALLQGIVICGKCGRGMYVFYPRAATPEYRCLSQRAQYASNTCQVVLGEWIDRAVERAFLAELKPAQIEMSLKDLELGEQRARKVDRQLASLIRRAQKAVTVADERLLHSDYTNKRAYARVQEDYEKKKAELESLERKRDDEARLAVRSLSPAERSAILALAQDFPRVWSAPTTDMATRKILLQYLVADVTITREGQTARVGIRWKTQAKTTLNVVLLTKPNGMSLPEGVIEFIEELAPSHSDREIAAALNEAGILNGKGLPYTKKRVSRLRTKYEIRKHPLDSLPEQREDGRYSSAAVARRLGTSRGMISRWCKDGRLDGVQDADGKRWWIKTTPEELAELGKTLRRRRPSRRDQTTDVARLTTDSVARRRRKEGGPTGVAL
jgi:DNA invertase Pin-like site-specific DNA recombinase